MGDIIAIAPVESDRLWLPFALKRSLFLPLGDTVHVVDLSLRDKNRPRKKERIKRTSAINTSPPTTLPAIVPVLLDFLVDTTPEDEDEAGEER